MKVICIDAESYGRIGKIINDGFEIECGKIYTVVVSGIVGGVYAYGLQEDPSVKEGYGWEASRFIPISNIDEKELIKERELLTEKI